MRCGVSLHGVGRQLASPAWRTQADLGMALLGLPGSKIPMGNHMKSLVVSTTVLPVSLSKPASARRVSPFALQGVLYIEVANGDAPSLRAIAFKVGRSRQPYWNRDAPPRHGAVEQQAALQNACARMTLACGMHMRQSAPTQRREERETNRQQEAKRVASGGEGGEAEGEAREEATERT